MRLAVACFVPSSPEGEQGMDPLKLVPDRIVLDEE